ncbi:MAG TPA: hypothetical protein VL426_02760 [Candidatus Binatia bacterium]|jgi:hypothetical protein|nr:hypothetical protein [Candidatus Binatia bacterium]
MDRNRKMFWLYSAIAFVGFAALVYFSRADFGTARAETPRASSWPSELVLPAGQKLVGVSWLCHAACEPWTATRPMKPGETAESYAFSNGTDSIRVRETPPSAR